MNEPLPPEAEDLVRFFRGLRGATLAEYQALVSADRAHGEDVSAEGDDKERA